MVSYPDEITYRLAQATANKLNVTLDQALEAFGEYWVLFTAEEGYGDLMKMVGSSVKEVLLNLNNLHSRIQITYPNLVPLRIECTEVTEHSLKLHYYSERPGLTAMVIGLVKGLAKRFQTPVEIKLSHSKSKGHSHDEFEVTF